MGSCLGVFSIGGSTCQGLHEGHQLSETHTQMGRVCMICDPSITHTRLKGM